MIDGLVSGYPARFRRIPRHAGPRPSNTNSGYRGCSRRDLYAVRTRYTAQCISGLKRFTKWLEHAHCSIIGGLTMADHTPKHPHPDLSLSLHQIHCRYARLHGWTFEQAAALWDEMKSLCKSREAYIADLFHRLRTSGSVLAGYELAADLAIDRVAASLLILRVRHLKTGSNHATERVLCSYALAVHGRW